MGLKRGRHTNQTGFAGNTPKMRVGIFKDLVSLLEVNGVFSSIQRAAETKPLPNPRPLINASAQATEKSQSFRPRPLAYIHRLSWGICCRLGVVSEKGQNGKTRLQTGRA